VGGKLYDLPRMPRAEYVERERAVRACLDRMLPVGAFRIPRWYGDKSDFGDLDVIVERVAWRERMEDVLRALGIEQRKPMGRLLSTVYDGLQTDFFAVPDEDVESTYTFMCFNDLGNLLGRMCRRFNLQWGEQGLAYVYRREHHDHYKAVLPVTRDFERVCAFLGLDHAAWVAGFATLESMFAWVVASPYFSVAPYDESAGAMARRVAHRPTIGRFVEYLHERGIAARPELAERTSYVPQIARAFPEARLDEQIARERAAEERARAIAAKFSGALVMKWCPHLEGRALGELIRALRAAIPEFDDWVLATPSDEIERRVVAFSAAGG
jgi:hypothetical protein